MKIKDFLMASLLGLLTVAFIATIAFLPSGGGGAGSKGKVYVYNWGDYIDESVNEKFEEETGIEVVYSQYATNEEMYAKIMAGGSNYDVIIPSDYMVERMANEGLLLPLDKDLLPNYANIDERFAKLPYDPQNEYAVPYMWGTMGIAYNTTMVDEPVESWDILWDPKYSNDIFMYDSERDSIMVALKRLGYSMNTRDLGELEEAKKELIEQKKLGVVYVGDEGKGMMENGEAAVMLAWAGDAMAMQAVNQDIDYAMPKEGTNMFVDAVVIPKTAQNVANAHAYIDFLCRPDISALNAEYIGYSTPISAARDLLPEEIKNSTIAYPPEEATQNTEMFNDPSDIIETYSRIWTEIKAAK
ncbi:MAG: ABC transporter substrate-binding protein [Cellulosilyticaceae bacterium]